MLSEWGALARTVERFETVLTPTLEELFEDHYTYVPFPIPQFLEGLHAAQRHLIARDAWDPGCVFLDVGCVDGETEFLSPTGWTPISQYAGGQVMQYHPLTGTADFVAPIAYIRRIQESPFLHLRTKYGINQMLTPDHKMLVWRRVGANRRLVLDTPTAAEFVAEHEGLVLGNKSVIETSFVPAIRTHLPLTDDEIRVQVMFNADGSVPSGNRRCKVALLKDRKIERARKLLDITGIPYSEHIYAGVTEFHFHPPLRTKSYQPFWQADAEQLRVVAEECLRWDGTVSPPRFVSRDKGSADFIHYVFAACGYRSALYVQPRRDGRIDYSVGASSPSYVGMAGNPKTEITRVWAGDGLEYCFTVPSGFLVLRRGGSIFVTGNCGIGTKMVIASYSGWRVKGIEFHAEYLEVCRRILPSAPVIQADASEFTAYDADLVYCYRLYTDPDDQDALNRHISEHMRPGSLLFVPASPDPDWLTERIGPSLWRVG